MTKDEFKKLYPDIECNCDCLYLIPGVIKKENCCAMYFDLLSQDFKTVKIKECYCNLEIK